MMDRAFRIGRPVRFANPRARSRARRRALVDEPILSRDRTEEEGRTLSVEECLHSDRSDPEDARFGTGPS